MAAGDVHKILIQVQSDISDINKTVQGLNNLKTATTSLTTGSSAAIGAWSGAFTQAFHDIEEAAKKTAEILVHFVEGFVEKAAEIQTEEFPLTQMLKDHGEVAHEVLEGMNSLWQKVGVISNESMASAARSLLLMNIPAENVIAKLIELGKVAIASGEDITNAAAAFQRMRQGAEKDIAPAVRGLGAFGTSSLIIFQALEDHFGKLAGKARISEGELISLFQGGRVTLEDINKALREASEEGGRFFNVFQEKRDTFKGAMDAMKTAWQGFQVQIGTPLLEPLTALIQRITDVATALKKLGEDVGWRDTLRIAWAVLMDEFFNLTYLALKKIAEAFVDVLEAIFVAIGATGVEFLNALKKWGIKAAFEDLGTIAGTALSVALAEAFGQNLPPELEKRKDTILGAIESILNNLRVTHTPDLLKLPPETPEETHRADTAKQLSAALHELELAMNAIREENTLISQAPFMGMDAKQAALITNVTRQMSNLEQELVNLKNLKDVLPLNDPQLAQLNVRIQAAQNRFKSLQQQLLGLSHPLQAELQSWANSFGTTAQQIGKTIEGTINVSLQSLNQYLVTGKFNAQALLQQIVLLGLQLIEQLAIQQIVGLINAKASAAIAATTGTAIAVAMAPAATAMTIATQGVAAVTAPAAVATALASIMGLLGGGAAAVGGAAAGLHGGGWVRRRRFHSGGLAADEVPIIAQEGEIMIQRSVAQAPGMSDFLLGLNAGEFHGGGGIRRMHRGGGGFEADRWSWFQDPDGNWVPRYNPPGSPILTTDYPFPPGGGDERDYGDTSGEFHRNIERFFEPFSWFNTAGPNTLGTIGPVGSPWWFQGPTMIPTTLGSSGFPMAVPVNWTDYTGSPTGGLPQKKESHRGGLISRFHSGGSVGGTGGVGKGGGVHIYAFTDLKQMTKHMASKEGQKIIFDTVKGRRIDLGIS